jgi:predicted esterase
MTELEQRTTADGRDARLAARPASVATEGPTGLGQIPTSGRPALLAVPAGYRAERPAPLVVMLHGAGGNARHGLDLLLPWVEENEVILLAPASASSTWDVIVDEYGPDVVALDQALARVFETYAIDADHVAIGGFSDGASYALSVGVANGDLFSHILAFSPGFMVPPVRVGRPRIYVSHGVADEVLPIERCSRRIVPALEGAGYDVRYHEFDGPHAVPEVIRQKAMDWFADDA